MELGIFTDIPVTALVTEDEARSAILGGMMVVGVEVLVRRPFVEYTKPVAIVVDTFPFKVDVCVTDNVPASVMDVVASMVVCWASVTTRGETIVVAMEVAPDPVTGPVSEML